MKGNGTWTTARQLARGRLKLWKNNVDMQQLMCRSAWYKHLAKLQQTFKHFKKRVDLCSICYKYDVDVVVGLKQRLSVLEGEIESFLPVILSEQPIPMGRAAPPVCARPSPFH